jgi:putative ABC transport system permease protein
MDVYIPIQTFMVRYDDRALVTQAMIEKAADEDDDEQAARGPVNYHQIDRLVVQLSDYNYLLPAQDVIAKMLERRHFGVIDYEIKIPERQLKQQKEQQDLFNSVLQAIALISLLVGGIGIMNIMLASVMERIKEIGLRMSLGAKRTDIIQQFLLEALLISMVGGAMGVILGVGLAYGIASRLDIPTIITPFSILISFGVAAVVGLLSGISPARKAANQDPILSLRYE